MTTTTTDFTIIMHKVNAVNSHANDLTLTIVIVMAVVTVAFMLMALRWKP